MATAAAGAKPAAWWQEPSKDQWLAWVAAWLGWTLDAFDFTIFLLIMLPISQEFGVPLTEVTAVFTITLWMRLVGAVSSGWMGDRLGRRLPLMISILGYSLCNFIAGFSPTFWFLFLFRALLGFFMGAEWPAGAALAMEQWPIRSRGFMSGVLQGSWGIGFLLSSAAYGLLYTSIGWRGLLWIGILPALTVVYVRYFVKGPPGLGRKPPPPAGRKPRSADPAAQHLQARDDRQYRAGLLVDGGRSGDLLRDQRDVRDPPAKGSGPQPGDDRDADRVREPRRVPRKHVLGLGGRPYRPPLGNDYPRLVGYTGGLLLHAQ